MHTHTHRSVHWVDGIVGLPTLSILKPAVDEALVGHLYRHVVHIFGYLAAVQRAHHQTSAGTVTQPQVTSDDCRQHTHVVDQQLVFLVLSSKLADQQLHETLEGGGHVHVLVLQLDVRTLLLHFLNQPGHQR